MYKCINVYICIYIYKGKLLGTRVGYWELDLGIYGCYYSGDCYIPKRNNQSVGWFWLLLCRLHRVGTALRVVKKNIWMFLLLLIQNCAIWLMAENRFVLSFTYTKLILFLLPCNLFVCGSFELYPNGKFTKKKLRDVRIFQVFTWAPFRLWWLMSLPTYKNIDIRYINKMFFLLCQAISYNWWAVTLQIW